MEEYQNGNPNDFKNPHKIKVDNEMAPWKRRLLGDLLLAVLIFIIAFIVWSCLQYYMGDSTVIDYWYSAKAALVTTIIFIITLIILKPGRVRDGQ